MALSYRGAGTGALRQLVAWSHVSSPSIVLMVGEVEMRERFGYALRRALRERGVSERAVARKMDVDPRKLAAWRDGKRLPNVYESAALAAALRVSEELFRNPPAVPTPPPEPYYPIEKFLLGAVGEGAARGLGADLPDDEDGDEPEPPRRLPRRPGPQAPSQRP